ncbi:hypothetical protein KFK09_022756 [Dendrobium nobile]|uniref:Uncharacterized protein n=1 Tax=Dendrobium nobile TaxID=94219 RepID=A0A8T3AJ85_DENNO|nr:hypothetical protein KFK09_022756 [Dendrobium nobile]
MHVVNFVHLFGSHSPIQVVVSVLACLGATFPCKFLVLFTYLGATIPFKLWSLFTRLGATLPFKLSVLVTCLGATIPFRLLFRSLAWELLSHSS